MCLLQSRILKKRDDNNWWYNYLEASKREKFFRMITDKALGNTSPTINVYKGTYPYSIQITKDPIMFSGLGLDTIFHGRSRWYDSDPLMSGMTENKIQACCFELADWTTITKIRFHEEWYFDPNKLRFEKKVLGIGMIVDTFNDEGVKTGERCLVYYKLNN